MKKRDGLQTSADRKGVREDSRVEQYRYCTAKAGDLKGHPQAYLTFLIPRAQKSHLEDPATIHPTELDPTASDYRQKAQRVHRTAEDVLQRGLSRAHE